MRRFILVLAAVLVAILTLSGTTFAQSHEFKLGFKALADQIPDVVGQPLEDEHWGTNGDSLQRTSNGLMAWRKADNWTAFTNGSRSWINGPEGLRDRGNNERFPWETISNHIPVAQPLYRATFEEGKYSGNPFDLPKVKGGFEAGELVLEVFDGASSHNVWLDAPKSFDLRGEVRFLSSAPAFAGLIFNRSQSADESYDFMLYNNGRYALLKWANGKFETQVSGQVPVFVLDGGVNHMRVVRSSDSVALYINGERLRSGPVDLSGSTIATMLGSPGDSAARAAWKALAVFPLPEGSNPAQVTQSPDPGWKRVEKPLDGMAIGLPSSWSDVSLDLETQEASLRDLKTIDPKGVDTVLSQIEQLRSINTRLYALDMSPETAGMKSHPCLFVVRITGMADVTHEYLVQSELAGIESQEGVQKPVSHRTIDTQVGQAEEFRYKRTGRGEGGVPTTVALAQYAGLKGRTEYVLTFVTTADRADASAPVFEGIARSFEMK